MDGASQRHKAALHQQQAQAQSSNSATMPSLGSTNDELLLDNTPSAHPIGSTITPTLPDIVDAIALYNVRNGSSYSLQPQQQTQMQMLQPPLPPPPPLPVPEKEIAQQQPSWFDDSQRLSSSATTTTMDASPPMLSLKLSAEDKRVTTPFSALLADMAATSSTSLTPSTGFTNVDFGSGSNAAAAAANNSVVSSGSDSGSGSNIASASVSGFDSASGGGSLFQSQNLTPATSSISSAVAAISKQCSKCGTSDTPEWRKGQKGEMVCNACGLRLARNTAAAARIPSSKRRRNDESGGDGDGGQEDSNTNGNDDGARSTYTPTRMQDHIDANRINAAGAALRTSAWTKSKVEREDKHEDENEGKAAFVGSANAAAHHRVFGEAASPGGSEDSDEGARSDQVNSDDSSPSDQKRKRFICPFDGCDKTYSTSGHAARHSRVHNASHPLVCPHNGCPATFTRRDNCMQHQRRRHDHVLDPQTPSHKNRRNDQYDVENEMVYG